LTASAARQAQGLGGKASAESLAPATDEQLRMLMELIPTGAFVWRDGQTEYVNAAAERLTGYTRKELLELSPWDLVHPDSAPFLLEQQSRQRQGQEIPREYELKMVRKDGGVRWMLMTLDRVQRPDENLWIGTASDITERMLADEALRRSEARYRVLYQDNPSMYFTVTPDGTVLDVNEFGASQLGFERKDLVGKPVLDVFHPDDKAAVRRQMRALLARPGESAVWQFRKVKKDGTVIWVEELARTTEDAEGNTVVLVVCEDVTARRQLEQELVALREELDSKAERAAEKGMRYDLSFRELTVLHLIVDGKSDKEIGAILGITRLTASKHVARILRKLKASSRTLAGVRAVREGLVE
jgi:PAS domain S-box-containing protein